MIKLSGRMRTTIKMSIALTDYWNISNFLVFFFQILKSFSTCEKVLKKMRNKGKKLIN